VYHPILTSKVKASQKGFAEKQGWAKVLTNKCSSSRKGGVLDDISAFVIARVELGRRGVSILNCTKLTHTNLIILVIFNGK